MHKKNGNMTQPIPSKVACAVFRPKNAAVSPDGCNLILKKEEGGFMMWGPAGICGEVNEDLLDTVCAISNCGNVIASRNTNCGDIQVSFRDRAIRPQLYPIAPEPRPCFSSKGILAGKVAESMVCRLDPAMKGARKLFRMMIRGRFSSCVVDQVAWSPEGNVLAMAETDCVDEGVSGLRGAQCISVLDGVAGDDCFGIPYLGRRTVHTLKFLDDRTLLYGVGETLVIFDLVDWRELTVNLPDGLRADRRYSHVVPYVPVVLVHRHQAIVVGKWNIWRLTTDHEWNEEKFIEVDCLHDDRLAPGQPVIVVPMCGQAGIYSQPDLRIA